MHAPAGSRAAPGYLGQARADPRLARFEIRSMKRTRGIVAVVLILTTTPAMAGLFHKKAKKEEVPGGHPPMVTPNGVTVPAWAAKRLEQASGPLYGKFWGRRPWAMPVSQASTRSSAYWAYLDQQGFGAGPIPGYTNGPPLGNVPSMPMGPDGGPLARRGFRASPLFPFFPYSVTGN